VTTGRRGFTAADRSFLRALSGSVRGNRRPRTGRAPGQAGGRKRASESTQRVSYPLGNTAADRLIRMMQDDGLPTFETEYAFATSIKRKWRFDVAWPGLMVAVEIEGGIFGKGAADSEPCMTCGQTKKGAHGSATGILRDIEKYNDGTMLGWRIYRVPTSKINRETIEAIRTLLRRATSRIGRIVSTPRRV
jgi:hypothetical protein